ncbi:hypothetical protein C0389_06795 [bacterium]|nr:hypothetical protein [bacterium]
MKIKENFKIVGKVKCILEDVGSGKKIIKKYQNIFVTVGKTAIARRLRNAGTKTNESIITYGATGTGANAPSAGDIKLQTELIRKTISSSGNVNNVLTIRIFYSTSESNGSLKEFGLFGEDATVTADSGTLFNRVSINITKTSSQSLTIECQITIG